MAWLPFRLQSDRIQTHSFRQIEEMEISLEARNCTGEIWMTDIMLQAGSISTMWQGHPSEVRWSDEYK